VFVDNELVAALEQVEERDWSIRAGDLDRAVELDHRQPPPGRGDRVALTGVRLLADQQFLARRLPGVQVDDGRLAGEVCRSRRRAWSSWCPPLSRLVRPPGFGGGLSTESTHDAETRASLTAVVASGAVRRQLDLPHPVADDTEQGVDDLQLEWSGGPPAVVALDMTSRPPATGRTAGARRSNRCSARRSPPANRAERHPGGACKPLADSDHWT